MKRTMTKLYRIIIPVATLTTAFPALGQAWKDKLNKVACGFYTCLAAGDSAQAKVANFIGLLISAVLTFLGIIFLILIIYAGYLWMTARGNDQQVEKARNILKDSVIGLIIVTASYAIVLFVGFIIAKGGFLK